MRNNLRIIVFVFSVLIGYNAYSQDSTFTNSIGMEFVLIKPGKFVIGKFQPSYPKPKGDKPSGNGYNTNDYKTAETFAKRDESPGFPVEIRKPFYIGRFEVTQEQWQKVMGTNPSTFQRDRVKGDASNHPVETITWKDAQLFIQKLNKLEKGKSYRLPTEFEWEYASRAGATEDISWEQIRSTAQLGGSTTNRIGQKKPNAWGLYDMLGNVWEWVEDYYNEKQFADPHPLKKGKQHVLKGASFVGDVKNATYMTHAAGPGNGWDVGMRVVLESGARSRE